jgi:predicted membrane GTPase involved in stress response
VGTLHDPKRHVDFTIEVERSLKVLDVIIIWTGSFGKIDWNH